MTRVVVTGGRDFTDRELVFSVLDAECPTDLAQGGGPGADTLAVAWYRFRWNREPITYFAAWGSEGRSAGPRRNQRMLDDFEPDLVIAFPGGKGTADCVRRARKMGIRVMEVTDDGE